MLLSEKRKGKSAWRKTKKLGGKKTIFIVSACAVLMFYLVCIIVMFRGKNSVKIN